MQPVSPVIPGREEPEVVYAKDQPQYQPLPSLRNRNGDVLSRWEFTDDEKRQIAEQGFVYLTVSTFGQPLQPLLMTVDPPDEFNSGPGFTNEMAKQEHPLSVFDAGFGKASAEDLKGAPEELRKAANA